MECVRKDKREFRKKLKQQKARQETKGFRPKVVGSTDEEQTQAIFDIIKIGLKVG